MTKARIFFAMPTYDESVDFRTAAYAISLAARDHAEFDLEPLSPNKGGYTHCNLWHMALNARDARGVTHFAMCHTDIDPEPFWVNRLWDAMRRTGAELVFATVALKDDTETLGCGYGKWMDESGKILPEVNPTKLKIADAEQLPEDFTIQDIVKLKGLTGQWCLFMTTGLWLADLRHSWCDDLLWVCQGGAGRDPVTGKRVTWFASEDYLESKALGMRGVKVVGTQSIEVGHICKTRISNWSKEKRAAHRERLEKLRGR